VNIFYIARKQRGLVAARSMVGDLLQSIGICPVDHNVLMAAYSFPIADYEDAVQHAGAAML
jgi:hypothetical protein